MKESLLEKAKAYDKDAVIRTEIDHAFKALKEFRVKYPFAENRESIETLDPNGIFRMQSNEVGEFFRYLEYYLKPIGHLDLHGSNVYRQIRNQLEDFKELLHVTVDLKKTLAQKVDAPWDRIRGLGGDRHIAKKIIFCFNHENGDVLPIFKTSHLEHFLDEIVEEPIFPASYASLGETHEFLISELLKVKQNLPETQSWTPTYFARFLYVAYAPPQIEELSTEMMRNIKLDNETKKRQAQFGEFSTLLNELRKKGEISAEDRRNYVESWNEQPQNREKIVEQLRILLSK